MKIFNCSLRVAMSHNVVPKVPLVVFPRVRVREDAGNEVACLVAFLHHGKTVEKVLKITDFFCQISLFTVRELNRIP